MHRTSKYKHAIGTHHLSSSVNTTCTLVDTYYKIAGTWGDSLNYLFESDSANKLTYIGGDDLICLFTGVSDLSVDAASQVTYALYLNGALVPGAETHHDFAATSKIDNISITNFVQLSKDDYIEIFVKSDNAGTVVTHNSLFLTFLGL